MNVGILTHHFASNFGANIQALSTIGFFQNNGINPIVINWSNESLETDFAKSVSREQNQIHKMFREKYMPLSRVCYSEDDIASVIEENNIDALVIGSDAVVQHHPLFSRIAFPTRQIVSFRKLSSDRLYPNIFWGRYINRLNKKIPVIFMSVSCQNSPYKYIIGKTKKYMKTDIKKFSYISVRDKWTKKMFEYIVGDSSNIEITPDPVFAFNQNANMFVPSKEDILKKFGLPEKYILLSFFSRDCIPASWIKEFVNIAKSNSYKCYSLPVPSGSLHNECIEEIPLPLTPIDWYALIKYSAGYVGRNMHPIIVSLHNSVPCFSFDQYGTKTLNMFINQKSSKIYDILERAELLSNRVTYTGVNIDRVSPNYVWDIIINADKKKYDDFASMQLVHYNKMMQAIINTIKNN